MIIGQQNNRFLQRVNPELARAKADGGSSNDHPEIQRLMRQMVDMGIADDLKLWVHSGLVKERVSGADVFAEKGYDISGFENDGLQATTSEQPQLNDGLLFDGTNDWLNHGNDNSLRNLDDDVSWSIWFNAAGAGTNRTIFSKWFANNNERTWMLRLQANGTFSFWISSNGTLGSGSFGRWISIPSYDDSSWHYLTVNYLSANTPSCSMFVDGVDVSIDVISSHSGSIFRSSAEISMGTQSQTSASRQNFWNGNMDDWRIMKALTLSQHTEIYNGTKDNYI